MTPEDFSRASDEFSDSGMGPLFDDPDTEESVLKSFEMPEVEDVSDFSELSRLDEHITNDVRNTLARYKWKKIESMTPEDLLEFCERLDIEPESLKAIIALEDIGFAIEKKNYDARAISRNVELEDIEDESKAPDLENRIETANLNAQLTLNEIVSDPILNKYMLLDERVSITKGVDEIKSSRPASVPEYEEREKQLSLLADKSREVEVELEELLGIETVLLRRERSFRRMAWLVSQDFMLDAITDFKNYYAKKEEKPTFKDLAEAVAGKRSDVFSTEAVTNGEADEEDESDEKPVAQLKAPGIVDKLIEEHMSEMASHAGKTNVDRENEALKLRRLSQAKALCVTVFENDLEDGIYSSSPIGTRDFKFLEFVKRRIYLHRDTEILESFLSFLPGSNLRNLDIGEREEVPLDRFSGRSTKEIFAEVDSIIENHPLLDREKITNEVVALEENEISPHGLHSLTTDAYKVLEKLVYKDKHTVRTLISLE